MLPVIKARMEHSNVVLLSLHLNCQLDKKVNSCGAMQACAESYVSLMERYYGFKTLGSLVFFILLKPHQILFLKDCMLSNS